MTGETPLVSILIPARNAGPWIQRCVDSSLAQDWPRIEVLVCDDKSSDNTAELLLAYGNRIQLVEGEGRGANVARNRLVECARGEWVQHLDADDEMKPNKISRQLAEAGNLSKWDVLYSPTIDEVWKEGRLVTALPSRVNPSLDAVSQWFLWELSQANGSLWRRASLQRIGGWKETQPCCQDNELYARALRSGLSFKFCPTPGAIYRLWSQETLSQRDPLGVLKERLRLMEGMSAWLSESCGWTPDRRKSAGRAYLEVCRQWALHDPDAASRVFKQKRQAGLIAFEGPAAPFLYSWVCRIFGFETAETLAALRRKR